MVWCGLTPSFLTFLNYFLGGKGSPLRSEALLPLEGDGDNSASPSPVSPRKRMQINKLGGLAILSPQMLSCKYTVNLQSIAPVRPPPLVHNKPRLRSGTPSKQQSCLASSHASARLYMESRRTANLDVSPENVNFAHAHSVTYAAWQGVSYPDVGLAQAINHDRHSTATVISSSRTNHSKDKIVLSANSRHITSKF